MAKVGSSDAIRVASMDQRFLDARKLFDRKIHLCIGAVDSGSLQLPSGLGLCIGSERYGASASRWKPILSDLVA